MEGLYQCSAEHREGANAMKQTQTVTRQTIDAEAWEVDRNPATNAIQRSKNTFVPAQVAPTQWTPPTLARPDQAITLDIAPRAIAQDSVSGSHLDQAKSFLAYAAPLCAGFGLVVLLLAAIATPLIAGGLGWALLKSLAVYFGAFLLAYIYLLERHLRHTPAGVALKESDNVFRFLTAEQNHRHEVENTLLDRYLEDTRR